MMHSCDNYYSFGENPFLEVGMHCIPAYSSHITAQRTKVCGQAKVNLGNNLTQKSFQNFYQHSTPQLLLKIVKHKNKCICKFTYLEFIIK